MIELSTHDGRRIFIAPAAIAEVHEAGTSWQWYGILVYVKTFDEVRQTAKEIADKLKEQA